MRLTTIWTLKGMAFPERLRRTRDWALLESRPPHAPKAGVLGADRHRWQAHGQRHRPRRAVHDRVGASREGYRVSNKTLVICTSVQDWVEFQRSRGWAVTPSSLRRRDETGDYIGVVVGNTNRIRGYLFDDVIITTPATEIWGSSDHLEFWRYVSFILNVSEDHK